MATQEINSGDFGLRCPEIRKIFQVKTMLPLYRKHASYVRILFEVLNLAEATPTAPVYRSGGLAQEQALAPPNDGVPCPVGTRRRPSRGRPRVHPPARHG